MRSLASLARCAALSAAGFGAGAFPVVVAVVLAGGASPPPLRPKSKVPARCWLVWLALLALALLVCSLAIRPRRPCGRRGLPGSPWGSAPPPDYYYLARYLWGWWCPLVGCGGYRGGGAGAVVVALVAARLLAFPALRRGPLVEGRSRFGGSSLAAKGPRPPSPSPLSGVVCLGGWSARRFRCGSAVVGFRFRACARVHF